MTVLVSCLCFTPIDTSDPHFKGNLVGESPVSRVHSRTCGATAYCRRQGPVPAPVCQRPHGRALELMPAMLASSAHSATLDARRDYRAHGEAGDVTSTS